MLSILIHVVYWCINLLHQRILVLSFLSFPCIFWESQNHILHNFKFWTKETRGELKGKYNKEHRKRRYIDDSFIKDTWTREFCCLPLIFSSTSLSLNSMNVLIKAGLGKRRLVFSKDDNHQQFVEKINKAYPHLAQCEGFSLHRAATGGYGRPLTSLNTVVPC